jgi:hypothetical protein
LISPKLFNLVLAIAIKQEKKITNPCFTPVIPTAQEAETRRIVLGGQPRANSSRHPTEIPNTKKGWWSGSSGRGPALQM